ncbi:helix-turn-helix transcriptional regulator [bacterium]|nr:helix-turn-helix transcriptional regulator [bacterium]
MGRKQKHLDYENCPIEAALDLIGGKWKGVILHRLLGQSVRFGELKRTIPRITQRMLTTQLRELEKDKLVHRRVYPQVPPKVEYSLTSRGESLKEVLHTLIHWGTDHAL